MIDVGANYGVYTRLLAKSSPRGRVFAFEPDPTTFRFLEHNAIPERSVCVNAAVGSHDGTAAFWRADGSDRSSTSYPIGEQIDVTMVSLDSFCADHAVNEVDFVKCDVEGGEHAVLLGASKIISSSRPPIWMLESIEGIQSRTLTSLGAVHDLLSASSPGGRFYGISPNGRLEEIATFAQPTSKNVFFVPEPRLGQIAGFV